MAMLLKSGAGRREWWRRELTRLEPGFDLRIWPEIGNPGDIEFALGWDFPVGSLQSPDFCYILQRSAHSHAASGLGRRQLQWSNDFPHPNSTWPKSREVIERVVSKFVNGNVARVYDLPLVARLAA